MGHLVPSQSLNGVAGSQAPKRLVRLISPAQARAVHQHLVAYLTERYGTALPLWVELERETNISASVLSAMVRMQRQVSPMVVKRLAQWMGCPWQTLLTPLPGSVAVEELPLESPPIQLPLVETQKPDVLEQIAQRLTVIEALLREFTGVVQ